MTVLINITSEPINQEHICYYTKSDGLHGIILHEICKMTYPHPNAPEHATITQIESFRIKKFDRRSIIGSHVKLLEYAQENCQLIMSG